MRKRPKRQKHSIGETPMSAFIERMKAQLDPVKQQLEEARAAELADKQRVVGGLKDATVRLSAITGLTIRVHSKLATDHLPALVERYFLGGVVEQIGSGPAVGVRLIVPGSGGPIGYIDVTMTATVPGLTARVASIRRHHDDTTKTVFERSQDFDVADQFTDAEVLQWIEGPLLDCAQRLMKPPQPR
jgi:hypothetical protein